MYLQELCGPWQSEASTKKFFRASKSGRTPAISTFPEGVSQIPANCVEDLFLLGSFLKDCCYLFFEAFSSQMIVEDKFIHLIWFCGKKQQYLRKQLY